jgi:hypothetical protein
LKTISGLLKKFENLGSGTSNRVVVPAPPGWGRLLGLYKSLKIPSQFWANASLNFILFAPEKSQPVLASRQKDTDENRNLCLFDVKVHFRKIFSKRILIR